MAIYMYTLLIKMQIYHSLHVAEVSSTGLWYANYQLECRISIEIISSLVLSNQTLVLYSKE